MVTGTPSMTTVIERLQLMHTLKHFVHIKLFALSCSTSELGPPHSIGYQQSGCPDLRE